MSIVMYHPEQDALLIYLTVHQCWWDMLSIRLKTNDLTPMQMLLDWGWELVGEL